MAFNDEAKKMSELELLEVAPEDLGQFTPEYGAPITVHIIGFEEGRFVPMQMDDVDLEIFDI